MRFCCLFDTPLGPCGLVWGPAGVARLQLPERDPEATLARLLATHPEAEAHPPDGHASVAVAAVAALLAGARQGLAEVTLDLSACTPFQRRVYEVARRIAPGETRTYGALARELGDPRLSRAVGRALGQNPVAILVPCHRVLSASGAGGFSARGGVSTKRRLLELEGAAGALGPLFARGAGAGVR
ncbi:MAG: methylated-DNA--[protein]-cysteine S-methyltransferase [Polyangiaceae bacterium]|nr:methylated-DNA--[protein]-cysteine S-methyltransferase [Polyangiaceae bacterium]